MSRFIKYASNLLDGVDNIAKDSLTDQDIAAAAAAERRRRRKQKRAQEAGASSSAAEQSEGGVISEDSTHYVALVRRQRDVDRRFIGAAGGSFDERTDDEEPRASSVGDVFVGDDVVDQGRSSTSKTGVGAASEPASAAWTETGTQRPSITITTATTGRLTPNDGAASAAAEAAETESERNNESPPHHRAARETHGGAVQQLSGKEDASVFSDHKPGSSADSLPLERLQVSDASITLQSPVSSPARSLLLPAHVGDDLYGDEGDGGASAREDEDGQEPERQVTIEGPRFETQGGKQGNSIFRAPSSVAGASSVSNLSLRVNASLSPTRSSPIPREGLARGMRDPRDHGVQDGARASDHGPARYRSDRADSGAFSAEMSPRDGGSRGRGRKGLGVGSLLGIRGRRVASSADDGEVEALRAEADELRAEVEELSLELEDAEDRLQGQEAELKTAADKLKRQRNALKEKENTMEMEAEELRALQSEEKRVFLTNLEAMERKLKEKERDMEKVRSELAALEAFAMEREDVATRLQHDKEELLEELKGARSGVDRSAEEVREALSRAEAEKEEVENRHRGWMRQAQARQTELEANAAQLSKALAEAERRRLPTDAQGTDGGGQGGSSRRTQASDRELRALRDELDSCQASLELEQERARSLQQEVTALRHDLDAARASETVVERQRQEHAKMAADAFAKVSRLEQRLEQEKAASQRLTAALPSPAGSETQIESLSTKLLAKQAHLEESVRERATLSVKLSAALDRATRAEQALREARGDALESGAGAGSGGVSVRPRRRLYRMGRASSTGSWSRLPPIAKHEKIATAVDVLDRQTLQAVVFLRNSSVARAIFMGYLLLLHLWAFLVLVFHHSNMKADGSHPT